MILFIIIMVYVCSRMLRYSMYRPFGWGMYYRPCRHHHIPPMGRPMMMGPGRGMGMGHQFHGHGEMGRHHF